MPLIECIPNVSEGRRLEWIHEVAAELPRLDVALLDYSADASHHRSVFTMAGSEAALHNAVMHLASRAVAAIDLRSHRGEHPRIGALDVVPFVPLGDTSMAACVDLATRVGHDLATRFGLPVFLYEEACRQPGRRRLEAIRRGGFEGLRTKLAAPEWRPDFGPAEPHPTAGATVVGARRPLIAFNVNLATGLLPVAQRIARTIRESSGGLPAVKAMAVTLHDRGIVQVSMNLTDYTRTPVQVVFDRIVAAAADDGVEVLESELIGLIPEAALTDTTPEHLRLGHFSDQQMLEVKLRGLGFAL